MKDFNFLFILVLGSILSLGAVLAEDRPLPGSVPVPAQQDEDPDDLTPEMPELPQDPEIRAQTAYLRVWFIPAQGMPLLSVFLLPSTGSQFHTLANDLQGTLLANYRDVPTGRQTLLVCPTELLRSFEEPITTLDLKRLANSHLQAVQTLDVQLAGASFQTIVITGDGVTTINDSAIPANEKRIRTINFATGFSPQIRLREGRKYSTLFSNVVNRIQEKTVPSRTQSLGLQMACQVTPDFEAELNMEVSLRGVRSCTAVVFLNRYNQLDFLVTRDAFQF